MRDAERRENCGERWGCSRSRSWCGGGGGVGGNDTQGRGGRAIQKGGRVYVLLCFVLSIIYIL